MDGFFLALFRFNESRFERTPPKLLITVLYIHIFSSSGSQTVKDTKYKIHTELKKSNTLFLFTQLNSPDN